MSLGRRISSGGYDKRGGIKDGQREREIVRQGEKRGHKADHYEE